MVRNDLRTRRDAELDGVARTASDLVPAASTIGVSGGRAMPAFARRLGQRDRLAVVTTSLGVAMELVGAPGIALTVTAGRTLPGSDHLVGPDVVGTLDAFHLDLAVVQVDGVVDQGLSLDEPLVARTIDAMILRAAAVIVIAEAGAIGRRASTPLRLSGRSYSLVAHTSADGAVVRVLAEGGVRIARTN
jgi:DeoR family transcriptional regulator of aga operon